MHIWAATHAWSQLCLGGLVSMPEADGSLSRLCVMSGVPDPVDVSALNTCQKEGALLAVALVLCSPCWKIYETGSGSVICVWVYTVTPRHSGLIDFTLGNFKPYLPASTGRPSLWDVISSPLKIPCPTEKSPRFLFQKTFKLDSVMQGASCGQNPFDTRSILTEMEKNHLPKAIWRIQFSLVMNFTSVIWILNLLSSQRLMLP